MSFETQIVSGYRYRDQLAYLRTQLSEKPWLVMFCSDDPLEVRCGSLNSPCRLEPTPFDDCYLDRLFFVENGPNQSLLGSAVTMRIQWNGSRIDLPYGWQATVRRCYRDCEDPEGRGCNTLVGMQVFTLSHLRNKGLSGQFLDEMIAFCRRLGYGRMIVPALLPTQFERRFADTLFAQLAAMKREDGLPYDHWLRLHVRKGARIVGTVVESHRFAMSLRDFETHMSSNHIGTTGEHLVRLDKDLSFGRAAEETWQRIYADVEHNFICFSWGSVWVEYNVSPSTPGT